MNAFAARSLLCLCFAAPLASGCAAQVAPPPVNAPVAALPEVGGGDSPREVVLSLSAAQAGGARSGRASAGGALRARSGDTVAVVLPAYPATEWHVARSDVGLGTPRIEVIPAWLGPEIPGQKFVWSTDALPISGDYDVEFTDTTGKSHESVTIRVEALSP